MNKIKKSQPKNKKRNFWKEQYSLSWSYIKDLRNYILFILVVLLWSLILGLFYQPPEIVELIQKFLKDLLSRTEGLNIWQMILFILNNNLQTSFLSMLLGVFLGIFPVLTAFSNGYVLGFVAEMAINAEGITSLWRLFPHGIFEFPALILSLALGTKLGTFIFAGKEKRKKEFIRRLKNSIGVFFLVVLPLLIIAAIIEGILIVVLS